MIEWTETLAEQTLWLRPTGTDAAVVALERIGPLFRVRETWHTPNITAGWAVGLAPSWHLSYNRAWDAFEARIAKVVEAIGEV